MILQALMVSKDDVAAEALVKVQSQLGVAVDRSNAADVAMARMAEQRYDQVIVDFDEPDVASSILEACRQSAGPERKPPVTVALLSDASQIRKILGGGAHFILTKPVSCEQAQATLRAATSLLKRERRQSIRVAIQAPVSLTVGDAEPVEGILLDLSIGGMDVLAAKPLEAGTLAHISFQLPEGSGGIEGDAEVAWATPNGQIGLRFLQLEEKMREQMATWLAAHSQDSLADEVGAVSHCKLTDLSLGGCYVETPSPFPQCSAVDLCLRASGMEIHAEGLVRVMHPGHGMGIEFPNRTEEQRKSVGDFINFLTAQPGVTPELETSPRSLTAAEVDLRQTSAEGSEDVDLLLELLRTGASLEEADFLSELQQQRSPVDAGQ
jgi:CheY-like chemotaxis protein